MTAIFRRVSDTKPTISLFGTKQSINTAFLQPTPSSNRQMTTSKRVKDRSKKKRVHDLEVVTEKWKIFTKTYFVIELLRSEPQHIIPIRMLDKYRNQLSIPKPHKISDFIHKSPQLFELYKDPRGTSWIGLTDQAEELVDEQDRLIEANSDKAAEYVTRLLMMSVDKRLRVDKIAHFRRDIGLPMDFKDNWVFKYPDLFKPVKCNESGAECLELVTWKNEWAVTELEKTMDHEEGINGMLSLAFRMKYPSSYKRISIYRDKIEMFQKMEYLSPYADARGLIAGSLEFDKRAVAIMHELLSFTLEKRLVTDHLTHFRREFVMPQKLMRLLLKHIGVFYVSERGKRFHVFLNEAYEGAELIEKAPLVLWKEKVHDVIGYRQKKMMKRVESSGELSGVEDEEDCIVGYEELETLSSLEEDLLVGDVRMDVREVCDAYY